MNKLYDNLDILDIKNIHDSITLDFVNFFKNKLYKILDQVNINSWIDKSVYLIGSPISVMKPYIVNKNIPNNWIAMSQLSIRTHNTKSLLDENSKIKYWSVFTWLSTLTNYNKKENTINDLFEFLGNKLNISGNDIKINISSKDEDLVNLLLFIDKDIILDFDTKQENYYKHKYWLWDIVWRNFNIALKSKKTKEYNDVWNFIIIENWNDKYWIEVAFGSSTIMKEMYGLDNVLEASLINSIFPNENNTIRMKFQDSVISAILLFKSWIIANSSNTKWRILKTYMNWIIKYSELLNISNVDLFEIMKKYELLEYWEISNFYKYFEFYKNK